MRSRAGADVVPFALARQIQDERDQALAHLDRSQHEIVALRRTLRDDSERWRAELEHTQARLAEVEASQVAVLPAPGEAVDADGARVQELLGDLANLRRRRDLDVAAAVKGERLRMLARIADVRDTVHWALAASPDRESVWHVGLVGIRDQIDRQLRAEGAAVFGVAGEGFDPRQHDAVGAELGGTPGTVLRVEAPGIRLDDGTVVRPARVLVSAS